jgi:hypothetical protein
MGTRYYSGTPAAMSVLGLEEMALVWSMMISRGTRDMMIIKTSRLMNRSLLGNFYGEPTGVMIILVPMHLEEAGTIPTQTNGFQSSGENLLGGY